MFLARWSIVLALMTGAVGCLNPATTRLPTLAAGAPWDERRSLGHHDPLPDRDLGPDTDSRPREFLEGRSQERQALEGNLMPGSAPVAPGPVPPGFSSGAYRDADVVR